MSDIRKYLNILTESSVNEAPMMNMAAEIEEYVRDMYKLNKDESEIINTVREEFGEKGADIAQNVIDTIYHEEMDDFNGQEEDVIDPWESGEMDPNDSPNFGEFDPTARQFESEDQLDEVRIRKQSTSAKVENFVDDMMRNRHGYEEIMDAVAASFGEEWVDEAQEWYDHFINTGTYDSAEEAGIKAASYRSDDDWSEHFNETVNRMKHLAGIKVSETCIYPDADYMDDPRHPNDEGSDGSSADQKFGEDEIYDGEEGPMKHKDHSGMCGTHETPKAPVTESEVAESEFSYAMAQAAMDGKKEVEIDGKLFPVKMSKEKASKILKK